MIFPTARHDVCKYYNNLESGQNDHRDPRPRPRGTITLDNANYGRCSGELRLLRKDFPADPRVNAVGHVDRRYFPLLDCVKRGWRCSATAVSAPCDRDGAALAVERYVLS